MSGGPQNNQMHPNDAKNMMIFFAISLLLFVGYYNFVMKPKAEQLEKAQKARAVLAQKELENPGEKEVFKLFEREEALSQSGRLQILNENLVGSIALQGGRIDDISLTHYFKTLKKEANVTVLSPAQTKLPRYIEHGWVSKDENIKLPNSRTQWQAQENDTLRYNNSVTLFWNNGQGLRFERRYEIDQNYMVTLSQKVVNNTGKSVTLFPYGLVAQRGIPDDYRATWIAHEGPMGYIGEELHEIGYGSIRKKESEGFAGNRGWLGITDKYWLTALIPDQGKTVNYRFAATPSDIHPPLEPGQKKPSDYSKYQSDYTGPAVSIAAGDSASYESRMFVGAKEYATLKEYEEQQAIPKITLAVNFGWFWFLAKPFFYALHYMGEFIGNFGVAIILLTIVIRSSVFPLTNVSYTSAAKMKKLAPQQMALREKCGDDKPRLQKEIMELYQREGVNPLGCIFPMMVQIPVFFALYKVLFVTIEMRHAPFYGWIQDLSAPDPTSWFNLFGFLPYAVPETIGIPLIGPFVGLIINIGVWPCLMLMAFMIQKKLNPPPQDKLQRDMANYFPFIMAIMLGQFAAGLVIYWTFSAFIGLIQQMLIMRRLNVPIYLFGQTEDEEKLEKAVEDGPGIHPLAEMAEHEIEDAMFGEQSEEPKEITPPKRKRKAKKK